MISPGPLPAPPLVDLLPMSPGGEMELSITLDATYWQTKRVVDPGNGTYQTVLTIDPSVGQSDIVGTYNCTVENVRGESSETVVVRGEP